MPRRRQSLPLLALACLVLASPAAADTTNTFSAAVGPPLVRASASASYTVTLTSGAQSTGPAHKAAIGIPPGFTVDPTSVQATTTAVAGQCDASTWEADGELIVDQRIRLRRPGADTTALCPGAALTVAFAATSPAADGVYTWTTELAHDVDGPFAITGLHPSVTVDGTPPQATITQKPNDPSNNASPTFAFTSDEPGSYECKLDAGSFEPCDGTQSYPGLADGSHTFAVRATDVAGNTGAESSYTWTLDTAAPVASIGAKPSDPSNDSTPELGFSANEAASFQCKLDGGSFAACSSPQGYTVAEGPHTFAVRATDAAGNIGAAATYGWTSDLTAPTTTITAKPASPTNDSSPSFTFGADEAAQFQCKLDTAAFAPCVSPRSYTALADGDHTFVVKATDAAGNASLEASHDWTIDTVAPVVTITGAPSSPTNGNSPSFAFTADGPATFRCKLNAGAFETCSSPKAYGGLPDGSHTFEVEATDSAGNTSTVASHAWTVDTDPPAVSITEKPAAASIDTSPSFSFEADEGGSSFQCKLDAEGFAPCASPKALSGLADGSHTFSVRAADTAGNVSPPATHTWIVDTSAPLAAITTKPGNPSNVSGPALGFTAGETATFQCQLDGGAFEACSSPRSFGGLADGPHTFAVRATDAAGNTGAAASYTWTIDTVAPTAAISAKPVDPSNNAAPSFEFGADEGGSSFQCKLDAAAFAACSSPKPYTALTNATHTFHVRATDAAGNTGAEAVYTWKVDTVAPVTTIGQKPPQLVSSKVATFAFSANEAATLSCKLDAEPAFASCTSPQVYSGLAEGAHTFVVKATDTAGNAGSEVSYTWTVDTVAPTTTITGKPADPSNTSFPSFSFGASESGTTYQCRLDGTAFAACTSPKGYSNLAEITHTFVVRAIDPAGNTGPDTTYQWTIDTTQPTASITSGPTNPSNEKSPTFAFSSDEDGSFSCKLDGGPFAACTSPKNYAVNLADGAHTFVVRPTDLAGNVGASVNLAWTIDTTGPIASVTQRPASFTNDSTPTFAFTSVDAASIHCSLDGGAFAPCTSPTSYPSLPDGDHSFAVKATDSLGNTGLATVVQWTIDTVAPTASITQKPATPSNETAPAFRFSSSEPGSTFACRLEEGGFAPCTSPKSYPGLVDGVHKFTVRATDAAGNTSPDVVYLWTIDTVAPATTIDLKPSALSNLKSPTFAFSAEPGSTFACRLDSGAVEPCTSQKSYSNLADGAHTFSVKATDGAGNTGVEASFQWTIDTVAPTAAIGTKPASPTNVTTPTFGFSSEPGASFTCTLDGAATACSSPKSYLPLADGPHTFSVKATDAAGNTGADAVHTWTIDTHAPVAQITGKPTDPSNVRRPSLGFTADEPATFACKLDDASFASCTSPKAYTTDLPDGVRTFSVRPIDTAGNTGAIVTYTWTLDTAAPLVGITTKPGTFSNVKSPSFAFDTGETGTTYQCRLDGGAFAGCTSPRAYSNLADGGHTFGVKATDAAGNTGIETTHTWTIDTVAPVATLSPPPSSTTQSPSFTFSSEPSATFECRLDAEPFVACVSPKVYAGLSDGPHTFAVKAIDRAGNPSTEKAYTWLLDATAPTTQIDTKPASPSNAGSPSFTFSADQPSVFECKLDAAPAFTSCASPKSYAGLADGPHTFMVRAIDTAGNTGAAKSHSWTIDTSAPVAVIADGPGSPSSSRSPSFSFAATDSSGYLCRLDGGAFAPCNSPLGYGDLPDGDHVFTVKATDLAGNIGPEATYAWTIKTVAAGAAVTSAPPGLVNSSAATFTFAAGEPSSFDCQMDDRSFAPCSSPTTYYGLVDGSHRFTVRPTDSLGNVGAPAGYSWTIDTSAPETTLTSAPKSGAATAATFRFSASEGGTFECRLDGAPFALCVSPKNYSGLSRAAHRFEVRAIDGAGNVDGTPSLHGWTIGAAVTRTASALQTPRAGARVTRPPLLVWRRVSRARYYNVQLYRGRRKVLTAWPTRTRLQLQARWRSLGRSEQLLAGTYRWYVWPGYGAPSARRYGQLLGQSSFVVARRSGR